MPIEILMPALSPTMTEGNLAKWLKKEGDKVKPGDVIAEIETDKATMEIEAVDEGVVGKILIIEGSNNIPVNSLIALLIEEGESAEVLDKYVPKKSAIIVQAADKISDTAPVIKMEHKIDENQRIKASPLAKRIAQNEQIDLRNIQGTGPYGRIIKSDLLNAEHQPKLQNLGLVRDSQEYTSIANSNVRKVIAKRLLESKLTIPHFYLSIECNIDRLLQVREEMNKAAENDQYKLSINDFIIKAVAMALDEVPEANASWTEEAILQYNNIDISVAVAIDGGLITPIIRNVNHKSISGISNEMKILAKKAKENSLKPEEFQGGGFTISNLGMYGIKQFQAIVNPPQSCILAVGSSNKRAVVIDNKIEIATIMDISISCDHRVVDGAVGARFLQSFKKFIEHPLRIFA